MINKDVASVRQECKCLPPPPPPKFWVQLLSCWRVPHFVIFQPQTFQLMRKVLWKKTCICYIIFKMKWVEERKIVFLVGFELSKTKVNAECKYWNAFLNLHGVKLLHKCIFEFPGNQTFTVSLKNNTHVHHMTFRKSVRPFLKCNIYIYFLQGWQPFPIFIAG